MEKNFAGLKVLDFSRVLVGPYLTQMMCDMGAEVIKVEKPGSGADERGMGPIFTNTKSGQPQSGYFMMLNRGKKSITLDLKNPKATQIIYDLVKETDVLVENYAPGVMAKLNLGYDKLKEINPGLIMCSISTFGQEGPLANRVGYDIVAQAMSGLMWMSGDPDRPPARSGTTIGDLNAGAHGLCAIGAALYYRSRTGKGQYIDISLRDCLTAILESAIVRFTGTNGQDRPHRSGAHHEQNIPYGVFDAGNDKYIALGALNNEVWRRLCLVMGKPEMIDDPRYNSLRVRGINKDVVNGAIEAWIQSQGDAAVALAKLEEAKVPSAGVMDIEEVINDPQLLMRDMIVEVDDPLFGPIKLPATPMRFSETTAVNDTPPPLLGEHTLQILHNLGRTDREIEELQKEKAL